MDDQAFRERVASIARVPPELFEFQRWLQQERQAGGGPRDYLFAASEPRFEPRKDDVVVPLDGLDVTVDKGQVQLRSRAASVEIPLAGVKRKQAERLLAAMDGRRTLLEVGWEAEVGAEVLARFLRATFGRVVMAPAAVVALEQQLSGTEVVRFPCVPYGIDRPYWENMIALRRWFEAEVRAVDDPARFGDLLRQLHVIALMGRTLKSFYKPASPAADHTVAPGSWFDDAVRLRAGSGVAIFLDGPRVNASFVGGQAYHAALYESLGDVEALAEERAHTAEGLSWGRVLWARSQKDDAPGPWFCPPRPIEAAHLEALRLALQRGLETAAAGDREGTLRQTARFHQRFVQLHPFHCANQSVAMNLANAVLTRVDGVGMPHLLLDHLALRLSGAAYERAFARAATAFGCVELDPARRLAELRARADASFELIRRLASAASERERRAVIEAEPEPARYALLR